ncbi:MAG: PAS domain-containing protein, partial [Pseudomonadota bacterium]
MRDPGSMNSPFFDSERVAIAGPETLLSLVSNVADIAVIVTRGGIIEDMFWNIEDLPAPERSRWHGAMLADLVTEESRPKITQMLEDMAGADQSRWREVNHLFDGMDELPVRYQAISAGGAVLFMGRELRAVAALQSRLVDAQRALDRDYGQMRQLETRYRVLFQTSAEALVIVDGKSLKIREANAAAGNLLGLDTQDLVGAGLDSLFSDSSQTEVGAALDRLNTAGGTETVQARSAHRDQALEMRATIFRAAETNMLLCRLHAKGV